jgi:SAM-dependent methyltransferase
MPWIRRGLVEKRSTAPSTEMTVSRTHRDELAQMRDLVEEGLSTRLNVENGLTNRIAELGQRIDTLQNQIANLFGGLDQQLTNNLRDLRRSVIGAEIHGRLSAHAAINTMRATDKSLHLPSPLAQPTLDATFSALEERYPRLFPIYRELLDAGERSYQASPHNSLSVYDNPGSVIFRAFCLPNLRGTVLDVGCGPVPVPIYLEGYDLSLVAGIDPFGSADKHPFVFVRAVAEGIPWADESFDTLVVSTSFDHFLDLALGLREMARVLKPNGELIAWVFYVPGMPSYDPLAANADKIDDFHLFHLDKPWFLQMMARDFAVIEELNIDGFSHFYRFLRKVSQ